MNEDVCYAIGLMSGTSLDGLDMVYVSFDTKAYNNVTILSAETVSYTTSWEHALKNAIHLNSEELKQLSLDYAQLLSEEVLQFIAKYNISHIDFIASHGHTIFHNPKEGFTLQIGDGQRLASLCGYTVVCDFRTQDVALGGQGAPLVPIGDAILFSKYAACLNLGGFANVSYTLNNERIAFDICAVNTVMNHYAAKLGLPFDSEGALAKSGTIDYGLFHELNQLAYYSKEAPKSLGIEWVHATVFPLLNKYELSIPDILHTYTSHIAHQIATVLENCRETLVTGGGVCNTFLMDCIRAHCKSEIIIPETTIVHFKEALVFAFLGLLRLKGEVNCLQSVTGAKKNHSSGAIFNPENL